jgi:hypothetical protein
MSYAAQIIGKSECERVALRGLRSYFNSEKLADILCAKHNIPSSGRHFAELQAESIKYCLQQALEYREAAIQSTFSRPTLVYYSIMSFALCDILFKRGGNFRLSKLREKHAHHGLEFSISTPRAFRGQVDPTHLSVRTLNRGTFAVWQETAHTQELFGKVTDVRGLSQTSGERPLTISSLLGSAPENANLLELAQSCPAIFADASDLGIKPRMARSSVNVTRNIDQHNVTFNVIIHPTPSDVLDDVCKLIRFSPSCAELVVPMEFSSGAGFRITYPDDATYVHMKFPESFNIDRGFPLMSCEDLALNEFGTFYLASYISGMFARYYPEYWARASEASSLTFQIIDAMMSSALSRIPLLVLGEFRERCYILE